MGRMIEKIALERGHEIVCIIDAGETEKFESPEFRSADVAIDFSIPSAEPANVLSAMDAGIPVVCGTTGWNTSLPSVRQLCDQGKGTLLWSSNFSVGVNIFRVVNRFLATIMNSEPQYKPSLEEVHHIHKLDHPSGTAVTIAEDMIETASSLTAWKEAGEKGASSPQILAEMAAGGLLPVEYERRGEVPGIHSVCWDSPQDSITLTHSAKSREGFALGAVLAAEWLKGKTGYHDISEMYRF